MSASSRQTGLPATLAARSQAAFTTAPMAMCMTPFSGPSHRSWLSPIMPALNRPRSPMMSSTYWPTTCCRRVVIAATTTSLPRPMVKQRACPSSPSASVRSTA